MRRFSPRLLTCAWLMASAAQAQSPVLSPLQAPAPSRPYTVEDLLARQSLGPVTLAPSRRWLVLQSTGAYATIERFDLQYLADQTISRLDLVDLKAGGPPRRLFADAPDYGYLSGSYSPSGEKMAVTRVRGHDIELGVLTLATGQAVWTGLTPVANFFGRTLQWRGDDEIIAVARDPDAPSFTPVYEWQVQARIQDKQRATAEGRLGLTFNGSGRYLGQHAAPVLRSLTRIDARTGQAKVLARADVFDLELSPDGSKVALLSAGEDVPPDPDQPARTAEPFRRHRLAIIDLVTGASWTPRPSLEAAIDLLDWSPDGRALLVYGKDDAEDWDAGRYWRIAPATRGATPISLPHLVAAPDRNISGMRIPRGQWMGDDPLIAGRAASGGPTGRRDWFRVTRSGAVALTAALPAGADKLLAADAQVAVFSDGAKVWRVTAKGQATLLAKGARALAGPGAPGGERLRVNDRPAPFDLSLTVSQDDHRAGVARWTSTALAPFGPALAAGEEALVADAGSQVVAGLATDDQGVETVMLHKPGAAPQALLTLNASLSEVKLSRPIPIRHPGADGASLTSWLYLPPSLAPGQRAPLVVIPYPGAVQPSSIEALSPGHEAYPNPQILAGAGYAVLLPSLPLDLTQEPMAGTAQRILKVVDAVGASGAPVDTDRLALWGHSYGAYAVLAAATQSPRFKAIIAAAASPDLIAAYERGGLNVGVTPEAAFTMVNAMGWLETGQARMGVAPWRDPDLYVRNSPSLHADKITAPVLLVTSDGDGDTFGPRAMFNVLFRQNKDAIILAYHGEGHQMFSSANLRDLYTRALGFLDDQVGGSAAAP